MFTTARLKLTGWYLLIIMALSILFSLVVYRALTVEVERFERAQRFFIERRLTESDLLPPSDRKYFSFRDRVPLNPQLLEETKQRILFMLIIANAGILVVTGGLGYFLAGRTLKPIKKMVDEQNRFITDASHELRTPITSLKTEIEVNLRDKKLKKETKNILESNLEEVNNLQSLSDNLIKLTQYQKVNGNITFENVSLKEIIDEACRKVANLAKHKKITIHNKVKDIYLQANKQSLTEAFVIFFDNAIKYSHKNTSITLGSYTTDHSIVIDIKDQGIGIDKEDIPRLFDRFYRVDKSRTKTDVHGYGLGLSIAKQIIDRHNGTISVESEINKGATFSIHLPVKQPHKII